MVLRRSTCDTPADSPLTSARSATDDFDANLLRLKLVLPRLADRNLSPRDCVLSPEVKQAYAFVEQVILRGRRKELSPDHMAQIVALDFKVGGHPISNILNLAATLPPAETTLISMLERRAIEAANSANVIEVEARSRIADAERRMADAIAKEEEVIRQAELRIEQVRLRVAEAERIATEAIRRALDDLSEARRAAVALSANTKTTYLSTTQLAEHLPYDERSIRESLTKSMIEGVHYFRGPGGRKLMWDWDAIDRDIRSGVFATLRDLNET